MRKFDLVAYKSGRLSGIEVNSHRYTVLSQTRTKMAAVAVGDASSAPEVSSVIQIMHKKNRNKTPNLWNARVLLQGVVQLHLALSKATHWSFRLATVMEIILIWKTYFLTLLLGVPDLDEQVLQLSLSDLLPHVSSLMDWDSQHALRLWRNFWSSACKRSKSLFVERSSVF